MSSICANFVPKIINVYRKYEIFEEVSTGYSGSDLSAMTHSEDPWKNAYDATNSSAICVQKITKDSLKEYYSVHNLLK